MKDLCKVPFPLKNIRSVNSSVKTIRKSIYDLIIREHPEINSKKNLFPYPNSICIRQKYLPNNLIQEVGEVYIEEDVLRRSKQEKILLPKMKVWNEATEYSLDNACR